jgi:hypothetical protein
VTSEDIKAEIMLILIVDDMKTRRERRKFIKDLNLSWEEYQEIKARYNNILETKKAKKGDRTWKGRLKIAKHINEKKQRERNHDT